MKRYLVLCIRDLAAVEGFVNVVFSLWRLQKESASLTLAAKAKARLNLLVRGHPVRYCTPGSAKDGRGLLRARWRV